MNMKLFKKSALILTAFTVTTRLSLAQEVNPPKEAYEAPKKEYSPYR